MKKQGVAQLKKKADKYFSQAVRLNHADNNGYATCLTCGVKKPWKELQAGHFVSRAVNSIRFKPENVNPQCYSCNVMRYGERYEYAKQLDLLYGVGTADKLHSRRFESHKFTIEELEQIIADSKEEVKLAERRIL